jgi:uncharacterized membrane protein (UPF0182 family)
MYTLALILLLATALYITIRGTNKKKKVVIVTGLTIGILTLLFFGFMNFWGEKLWFDQMGYNDRFWTEWSFKIGLFIIAFLAGGLIIYLLTYSISKERRSIRQIAVAAGAILSGFWWYARWEMVLKFINRIPTDISEPILNQQTGFYLFSYPVLQSLYAHLLVLSIIAVGTSLLGIAYMRNANNGSITIPGSLPPFASIFIGTGVLFLVLALGKFIARYGLLFSEYGIVSGPGWTDVNVRLPMLNVVAVITAVSGVILFVPGLRNRVRNILGRKIRESRLSAIYAVTGVVFGTWLILLGLVPVLFQWLKVEPNEITVEKPFIENNIRFTRSGFHLDRVEEKEYAVSEELQREAIEENKNLFSNIRLWDYRALDAVFKQFQEIRLYYEFDDVDIDRYTIDGFYREVMVSAREIQPGNLPLESQTFVNKRFKYTHGYGAVLNLVNEFTPDGLPNLLIKDIPPVSSYENLTINRPELYYGELSSQYVVVNSKETEFDYPSGEKNVYAHYDGSGGVQISNFWRKLLYGWKFGGTKFLLSGYPSRESRIMMHRQIAERVNEIAPFLLFDGDPYIVISEGKLFWIIDAYTSSSYYPYSEPFSSFERISYDRYNSAGSIQGLVGAHLQGENYIRNSVKVVIDAYNGNTDLYIFEEDDPLVQVYNKIFPGLLKNKSEMSESLKKHIRYPADMLLVQGMVYAKYHMQDPTVFYNQEDLWIRATEKYYSNVQPVEPYYIMWKPPGSDEMEFVLILPFTPKNKQVMIGWIAGMCDDENYGRFLAYQFPKEKRVLGTQQVETKIDQDSYLSGQLTLWDQRGSSVIRGNVLAIPINNTIIYVEPIYLKSETSAYPELRLVAVMHNDNLSYAETFDEALMNLFARTSGQREAEDTELTGTESIYELIDRANDAFENYLQYMQQREFDKAGSALQNLEEALQKLSEEDTEGVK